MRLYGQRNLFLLAFIRHYVQGSLIPGESCLLAFLFIHHSCACAEPSKVCDLNYTIHSVLALMKWHLEPTWSCQLADPWPLEHTIFTHINLALVGYNDQIKLVLQWEHKEKWKPLAYCEIWYKLHHFISRAYISTLCDHAIRLLMQFNGSLVDDVPN